jgi:small subunit ribosomal protein S11
MAEELQTTTPVKEAEQTQAAADETVATKPTAKRKKSRRTVAQGQVHVLATFNNTIITVTDSKGNTLTTASAGALGFRGSKKGTAYAAQVASEKAVQTAKQNHGLSKVEVFVKGIGQGRDAAVRTLINEKIQVDLIRDVTGVPHGGTRPRKQRRT